MLDRGSSSGKDVELVASKPLLVGIGMAIIAWIVVVGVGAVVVLLVLSRLANAGMAIQLGLTRPQFNALYETMKYLVALRGRHLSEQEKLAAVEMARSLRQEMAVAVGIGDVAPADAVRVYITYKTDHGENDESVATLIEILEDAGVDLSDLEESDGGLIEEGEDEDDFFEDDSDDDEDEEEAKDI